jgi:hypothetical protein
MQYLIKKVDEQGEGIKELKQTSNISVGRTTTSSELNTSNNRNITHAGMFPHIRAVTPSQTVKIDVHYLHWYCQLQLVVDDDASPS